MKPSIRNQRGIALIGWLSLIMLASLFLTIAFKLGPHYMDYLTIRSVMKDVSADSALATSGKMGISDSLQNRLDINSIRGVGVKAFKFTRTEGGYLVSVEYQVQEHLFYNVDAVLHFAHEVSVIRQ